MSFKTEVTNPIGNLKVAVSCVLVVGAGCGLGVSYLTQPYLAVLAGIVAAGIAAMLLFTFFKNVLVG